MPGSTQRRVFVVGVGLTKFERPLTKNWDYPDMGREAGITDGVSCNDFVSLT